MKVLIDIPDELHEKAKVKSKAIFGKPNVTAFINYLIMNHKK